VAWEAVPYCVCDKNLEQKYKLQNGDILVARIGATTGKTFLVENPQRAIFASYLMRIRTKQKLDSIFLNYFFQSPRYWRQMREQMGGRLKGGVNIPIIKNLQIPVFSLPEQREIAQILQTIDQKIEIEEKKKELYEELFRAMLDGLLNRKIEAEKIRI